MAGFFKKLFGGAPSNDRAGGIELEAVEYKGVLIVPAPRKEGGQWRLGGLLREAGGEGRQRPFLRADMFADAQTAAEFAIRKGKLIVDERGPALFSGDSGPL
ncbi:MAG: hypothetical protein K8H74_14950 [Notoacmeibacter sp.]|nr:hypothetical protein [Notoacmeibacter sp.]